MRNTILFFIILLCCLQSKAQSSIYSFKVDSVTGSSIIDFSTFQGKVILVVNAASQDSAFRQYQELMSLYKLYADSLVIVVFPSNSFNSEPLTGSQLAQAYLSSCGPGFIVAAEINVAGPNIHPLYAWLTQASENGVMDAPVNRPFKKFLIGRNGQIKGTYSSLVDPMSSSIRQAIVTRY
jgi:glutathione peroxidase